MNAVTALRRNAMSTKEVALEEGFNSNDLPDGRFSTNSSSAGRERHALAFALLVISNAAAFAADVRVTVAGAVPNGTAVYASLCNGGLDPASCKIGMRQRASSAVLSILFRDVEPGRYAVVAFQDLDGDGTLERSKLGLPLEPYAISRNAGRQRRPTFQAASFPVESGETDVALELHTLRPGSDNR